MQMSVSDLSPEKKACLTNPKKRILNICSGNIIIYICLLLLKLYKFSTQYSFWLNLNSDRQFLASVTYNFLVGAGRWVSILTLECPKNNSQVFLYKFLNEITSSRLVS